MKKLAEFLINRRRVLTAVMLALTVVCAVLALRVPINRDRTKYLADSSEMKQGLSIMEDVFPESDETASIRVMFDDLTADQIPEIKAQLEAIPNVSGVAYEAGSEEYNKDNHTLFVVNSRYDYDTDEEHAIEAAIEEGFSGYTMAYENNDVPATELPLWVVVLALTLAVIILLVMSDSWLDPVLFLVTIGVAVVLNMGTNILFPYVDEMTATVGPILQLVLSMDYSIILMNRYRQEKVTHSDKVSAMKTALAGSVSSIASSSLTTVVGLLALVFLSFKLGPELGIVLAKGVFISMLCAFTVLPAMILAMDPLLEKTRKKSPHVPMARFSRLSYKTRYAMPAVFAALFIASFILQGYTQIVFTEENDDPLANVFPKKNTVAVVYRNEDEAKIDSVISELEKDERVSDILGYANTLGKEMTAEDMGKAVAELSDDAEPIGDNLLRMLYFIAEDGKMPVITASDFINFITDTVLPDKTIGKHLDAALRDNAEQFRTLADRTRLTTAISVDEMAELFGIDRERVEKLYLYYTIQNGVADSGTMTLPVFVDYVLNSVAANETYGSMVSASAIASLRQLQTYTNTNTVLAARSAADLAALIGADESTVNTVFILDNAGDVSAQTMSLPEFSSFLCGSLLQDALFSSYFDDAAKAQAQTMDALVQLAVSGQGLTPDQMAQTEQLYILRMGEHGGPDSWTISPRSFVAFAATDVLGDAELAKQIDEKTAEELRQGHTLIEAVVSEKAYTASEMSALLSSLTDEVTENETEILYLLYGGVNDADPMEKMTIVELFDLLCDKMMNDGRFAEYFDGETKKEILDGKAELEDAVAQMRGKAYARMVVTSDYPDESPETSDYVTRIDTLCRENLSEYYLVGNSVMVSEMDRAFDSEYRMISLITAISVFLVVLIAFRHPILPLILTLLVQCGVFITVTVIGAYSGSIYYLALLIVQSILMGATIDYGIVFCNFYMDSRKTMDVTDALRAAYEGSIHTIMTSGSILVLVLAALGILVSSPMISDVSTTLSIGALVAMLLILLVLPGMTVCCDRLINRKKTEEKTKTP